MNLKIFVMIGLVLSSGAIVLVYPRSGVQTTENYEVEPKNNVVLFVPHGENWTALAAKITGPLFYRYFASDGYALVYEQKLTEHLHLYTADNGLYKTYTVTHNGFPYQPLWVEEVTVGKNLENFVLSLQYASSERYIFYFDREIGQLWEKGGEAGGYLVDTAISPNGEFLLVAHSTVVWIYYRTMDNQLFHDFGLTTEAVDTNGEFVVVTVEWPPIYYPYDYMEGKTYLFDNEGNLLWEAEIAGDLVFMGSDGWFASIIRPMGDLYLFRPEDNQPVWHFEAQEILDQAVMSENDNLLLVGTDNIYLFNKTDSVPVFSTAGPFSMVVVSPDGRYFSGARDNTLFVFHADPVFPEDPAEAKTSTISEGSVTLRWFEDPSADRYTLQLSQSQPFENENIEVGDNYAIMELTAGTYFWRVNPIAPDGTEGNWSEVQTLIVEPPEVFKWTMV